MIFCPQTSEESNREWKLIFVHILEKLLRDLNTLKENPDLSLGNDLTVKNKKCFRVNFPDSRVGWSTHGISRNFQSRGPRRKAFTKALKAAQKWRTCKFQLKRQFQRFQEELLPTPQQQAGSTNTTDSNKRDFFLSSFYWHQAQTFMKHQYYIKETKDWLMKKKSRTNNNLNN